MKRRDLIVGALALPLAGVGVSTASEETNPGLREFWKFVGFEQQWFGGGWKVTFKIPYEPETYQPWEIHKLIIDPWDLLSDDQRRQILEQVIEEMKERGL